MKNNFEDKKISVIYAIGLSMLISIAFVSCGHTKQDKTVAIIKKMKLIENQETNFKFQLDPLKYQAVGKDSLKIIEIENQLTEGKITKRIITAFNEVFSEEEINDIYGFIQTSAFEKFFNSGETYKVISSQFKDIDNEIKSLTSNLSKPIEKPTKKFKPIPVDKEDGFYTTVDYTNSTKDKDIKLEENPSLTPKDILKVEKVYSNYNNRPEISIVLTKGGTQKFHLITKENIGKPIAIVIENQIVSMPIVNSEIIGGKISISGDFTEKEIDNMIDKLKEK